MGTIKVLQLCAVDFTMKNLLLPLINRLQDEGFEVCTVCTNGPEVNGLRNQGYKIKTIKILRKISPWHNFISLIRIYKYIRQEKFDIVHVHTPVAGILGRFAAKLAGVPLVIYTAHGFYFHDEMPKWKREIFVGIEKFTGRLFTDLIFTQSKEDLDVAVKKRIISPNRIFHIGNGVNINKFNGKCNINKKCEFDIAEGKKVIGFIGRIVKEKGIIDLINAFDIVLEKKPDTVLLIIGDNTANERDLVTKKQITDLINKYRINKEVIFTGLRTDINELLSIIDVFVLPSYREGMPRSIIEAMAMGKPVVATNIRGCREEIIDEKNGYLVPVNDYKCLAEKILKILNDERLALSMGQEGKIMAQLEFDEEKVLDKQIKIMHEWLHNKR